MQQLSMPTHLDVGDRRRPGRLAEFFRDFVLGGCSGAIAKTAAAPLERVKIVIQTQDAHPQVRSGAVRRYSGFGDCVRRIYSEQGLRAFWRGNLVNVSRYVPTQAFNLSLKDSVKGLFPKYSPDTDFGRFYLANLASGGIAGAMVLTFVYPLDYARTRLACDVSTRTTFSGPVDCIVSTVKGPLGVLGLYRGYSLGVTGIVVYRGVQLGTFDTIMGINPLQHDLGWAGGVTAFAAAQVAALLPMPVAYPMDTLRRRYLMDAEKREGRLYHGYGDCVRKTVAEEGVRGFFKGFGANALRSTGAALVLVLYDRFKQLATA